MFVYLVAASGVGRMLRQERLRPTSYPRSPEYLAGLKEPPVEAWVLEEAGREAAARAAEEAGRRGGPSCP